MPSIERLALSSNIDKMNGLKSMIVRVCTFNLRREGMDRGTPNDWIKRRPIMKKCLEFMQPHIIATQEGIETQLNNIRDDLNESTINQWSWIGKQADEFHAINAIFYRQDLFSLIKSETFWFNESRLKPGPAWGARYSCACTWAHLQSILTKQSWIVFNVHLDYPSQNARHHSIPVLLSEIEKNFRFDRVIITGDFNSWPEEVEGTTPVEQLIQLAQKASEIQQMKQAGFVDTYQHGERPTFNGFRSAGYGPKIDFIWTHSSSIYSIEGETKIDDYHDEHGFFPSDHFPIYTDFKSNA